MKIKPFAGVRPPKELASEVASRPYDVLNSVEAKAEAGEKSLPQISRQNIVANIPALSVQKCVSSMRPLWD